MEKLMNCPTAEKLFFVEPGTAEEICKVLEEKILKYFPPQIEKVDPFIFADVDAAQKTAGDHRNPPAASAIR
jgi:hypothetical protein